jgi:hypothetical protein
VKVCFDFEKCIGVVQNNTLDNIRTGTDRDEMLCFDRHDAWTSETKKKGKVCKEYI